MKDEDVKRIVKLDWIERVKRVAEYHATRCRDNPKQTLEDTAKELNRSQGRISQDIMLAQWMRTHPRVEKFKNPSQALEYIRAKKKEMKLNADFGPYI